MTTCARCTGELPRSRVHIDGKEYHLDCYRTEADWRELDRLAELVWPHLTRKFHEYEVTTRAYEYAEAMLAERKRRRET